MFSRSFINARRALAIGVVVAGAGASVDHAAFAQAGSTIDGVVASQPNAPAKIVSCAADTNGTSFLPRVTFDPATPLKSATVTFSFFDATNGSLGELEVSPPYRKSSLPLGTDTFTCAITREELVDGTVFPAVAKGGAGGTALVVAGLAGVGIIAALSGHGGSGPSGSAQTPSPSTPVPATPTPKAPTASPTATATATPTATVTTTATPTSGSISLAPASLTYTSAGATMSTTIAESGGYAGTFSVKSTTCGSGSSAIATLSAGPYANPSSIMVTSQTAGNCMVVFADATGNTVTLAIGVTTTGVVVNKRPASRSGAAPHKT